MQLSLLGMLVDPRAGVGTSHINSEVLKEPNTFLTGGMLGAHSNFVFQM